MGHHELNWVLFLRTLVLIRSINDTSLWGAHNSSLRWWLSLLIFLELDLRDLTLARTESWHRR